MTITDLTKVRARRPLEQAIILNRAIERTFPVSKEPDESEILDPRYVVAEICPHEGKKLVKIVKKERELDFKNMVLAEGINQEGNLLKLYNDKLEFLNNIKGMLGAKYDEMREEVNNYYNQLENLYKKYDFLFRGGSAVENFTIKTFTNEKKKTLEEFDKKKDRFHKYLFSQIQPEVAEWIKNHLECVLLPGVVLGRSKGCDIVLPESDNTVSRVHGMIEKEKDRIVYRHLGWHGTKAIRFCADKKGKFGYIPDEIDSGMLINLNELNHQLCYIFPGIISSKIASDAKNMIKIIYGYENPLSYIAIEKWPIDAEPNKDVRRFGYVK
ncbi:MAG: FHA domain-containing protein [Candidatus Aenigmatarchaeota archaeon]